jgi:hypothetical protein
VITTVFTRIKNLFKRKPCIQPWTKQEISIFEDVVNDFERAAELAMKCHQKDFYRNNQRAIQVQKQKGGYK